MPMPDPRHPSIVGTSHLDLAIDENSITFGHWCPTCLLPSAAEMRITWASLEPDGVRSGIAGRYRYCTEHAGPIYDQERTDG